MNAYELADELLDCGKFFEDRLYTKAGAMLRQQADRIAELEKELNHMRSFFGCDPAYYGMTPAEPVAWLHIQGNYFEASDRTLDDDEIERGWEQKPLYTTPQTKPLSDEEIWEYIPMRKNDIFVEAEAEDFIRFARAIEERILGK